MRIKSKSASLGNRRSGILDLGFKAHGVGICTTVTLCSKTGLGAS